MVKKENTLSSVYVYSKWEELVCSIDDYSITVNASSYTVITAHIKKNSSIHFKMNRSYKEINTKIRFDNLKLDIHFIESFL